MAQHNDFGQHAEQAAKDFLVRKGYQILAQNYRHEKAEIDLICRKDDTTAFVEVKARHSVYFGHPEEYVTPQKEQLLLHAADQFIAERELQGSYRFDIISIVSKGADLQIKHIEDAFFPTDNEDLH